MISDMAGYPYLPSSRWRW